MRAALPILALVCASLTACASSVRKPDVRLPGAFEAPQAPHAEAPALDHWWTAFNDPQLNALIDDTLRANPDAQSAIARLREARASRANALARFLPQGDITADATRTETNQITGPVFDLPGFSTSGVTKRYSANLNVTWEVDVFGRVFAERRTVNADLAAARFDYEATRASLAAQVADAYFQARGLAIQLADARETERIQRELYDLTSKRAQAGLAATADADRIAGDLAQAQAQAQALDAELQIQRRTLLVLAGRVVDPTSAVTIDASVGEAPPVPASAPSQLLARRPDVRQAEERLKSAIGQRDLARMQFFPLFTLRPGSGWSKQDQPNFLLSSWNWSIGAGVTQPLLDIPQLLAQLHIQSARAEQAVATYEKTLRTAFTEAEASLVRLDADRRRVAILTDGEARAARAYRAARIGYERGFNDLQTTLSAEQAWRSTHAQLTSAQVDAVRRAITAYKALGGGWPAQQAAAPAQAPKDKDG